MSEFEFKLPDIGEGLSEGEIVRWHVAAGEAVTADQILVEVETDKAVVEIPAPVSGVLKTQGGAPGDILPIGGLLAVIETDGATKAEKAKAPAAAETPAKARRAAKPPAAAPRAASPGGPARRIRASPATRKLAVQLGIDIATVTGTGERGLVTRNDVKGTAGGAGAAPTAAAPAEARAPVAAPAAVAPPEGEDRVVPLRGLRRRVAQTMAEAWRDIPHIWSMREIEADTLVGAQRGLKAEFEERGVRFTYLPIFVKAAVAALKRHPNFNASIDVERDEIIYRHRYNIGLATATPDGLMVTVVHDADRLSLPDLAARIEALSEAARQRKIRPQDLAGGTFTISNFGSYGGWMGTPIIRPPEVAIAGFGRIREAVVAVDGAPAVRTLLPLVVAADHRMNDGQHLGEFMATLATYLGNPIRLLVGN